MHPYYALKSIGRVEPTSVLDIGTRDFVVARVFAENGFDVHAIDPNPSDCSENSSRIAFETTTLEDFDSQRRYGVVIASYVSHLVTYETNEYLQRLRSLTRPDGLIYVTTLGDQDGWAEQPWAKAADLETTCKTINTIGLQVLYQSVEWFDGHLYDGTPKHWHVLKFVLSKET